MDRPAIVQTIPAVPAEEGELVRLTIRDEWQIALRNFTMVPRAETPVILVFAAMGAPARAYRRLARWFAARGYPIATVDTRGTGESTPAPRRGIDFGIDAHLYGDLPAAVAWARDTYPGRPLVLLGHSIGGQMSGLHAGLEPGAADALVLLTTTSVWWRFSPSWRRRLNALRMFTVFSMAARLLGYFPGERFNWGNQILARGVVLDWARWGFTGHYSDSRNRPLDAALASVDLPVLSVSFTDDLRLAPREACDDYLRRMPRARLTRWHLAPGELGWTEAGHFAHLRHGEALWARIEEWLAGLPLPGGKGLNKRP